MNKYLRGFINGVVQLASGFVGMLVSMNILAAGFIAFPLVVRATDPYFMIDPNWWTPYVPGCLPLIVFLGAISLSIFVIFRAIEWGKNFDIANIVNKAKADVKKGQKIRQNRLKGK